MSTKRKSISPTRVVVGGLLECYVHDFIRRRQKLYRKAHDFKERRKCRWKSRCDRRLSILPCLAGLTGIRAVPKNRRPKFECTFVIHECLNVPLNTGGIYVKWHFPSSSSDHGKTSKADVKNHKAEFEFEKQVQFRITADKQNKLEDFYMHFEVVQEYVSGLKSTKMTLGKVYLNLSEYIDAEPENVEDPDEIGYGVTRKYLLKDAKVNSTLKLSIQMEQIEGERDFSIPPLQPPVMFGTIVGMMKNERKKDGEEGRDNLLYFGSQQAKDAEELQNMYRRVLAAKWSSAINELPADKCVEDIFRGGDGFGKHNPHRPNEEDVEEEVTKRIARAQHNRGNSAVNQVDEIGINRSHHNSHTNPRRHARNISYEQIGRGMDRNNSISGDSDDNHQRRWRPHIINEDEVCEDMRSWVISEAAA